MHFLHFQPSDKVQIMGCKSIIRHFSVALNLSLSPEHHLCLPRVIFALPGFIKLLFFSLQFLNTILSKQMALVYFIFEHLCFLS